MNGIKEGKGIRYLNRDFKYEGVFKMINMKEKEFIISKMGIYMKVILKMIKEKEKEFIILIMVIEKWIIFMMISLKENL